MIMEFNGKTPDISKALFVAETAVIIGDVTLEEGASVWFGAVLRGDSGPIHIGKNSNVQDNCVLHCDAGGRIEVGENVTIGHSVTLHGCKMEDGSLIGMGATILNNAVIGKNCLVGAGALVPERREYADASMIIGCPAKQVKQLSPEQLDYISGNAKIYLEEAGAYVK